MLPSHCMCELYCQCDNILSQQTQVALVGSDGVRLRRNIIGGVRNEPLF